MNHKVRILRWFLLAFGFALMVLGIATLNSRSAQDLLLSATHLFYGEKSSIFWGDRLSQLGIQSIIVGLILSLAGWLVTLHWEFFKRLSRRVHFIPILMISALLVFWLPVILFGHSSIIAGERYWWLGDDAMISMRYAHNLAEGHGLVWNPGERVEGYTNFLWTLYMALVHLLPIAASKTSLIILLTNLLLSIFTVLVIGRLVKILGGGIWTQALVLTSYVLNINEMHWATSGFETPLLTLLFLLGILRILEDIQQNNLRFTTYLGIATISLVRADALIYSMLLFGLAILLVENRRTLIKYISIALLLPIGHMVFRVQYYGDLLPNTAYLKTFNWEGKYTAGVYYLLAFLKSYFFPLLITLIGSLIIHKKLYRLLFVIISIYAVYVVSIGGDAFPNFRFFVPIIPLLMILTFVEIEILPLSRSVRQVLGLICLGTIPLIFPAYHFSLYPREYDLGNVKLSLYLKENTPLDCKIADTYAGIPFYFSDRYGIDLLGKCDRYIAHLSAIPGGMKPGHNKFDFDYSLGKLKPDVIVANFKLPVTEDEMRKLLTGSPTYCGYQLYFNPIFREHYLNYELDPSTWRSIFVRDGCLLLKIRTDSSSLIRN